MKAWAFRIHCWFGGLACLYILLLAGTGTILSFRHELESRLAPELFQIAPEGEPLPLEAGLRIVHQAFPGAAVRFVFPPRTAGDPLRLEMTTRREVFVNPYTGDLLGTRLMDSGFLAFIRSAHVGLLFGSAGKWLGLAAAASLLTLAVTGLLIGRPFRLLSFRSNRQKFRTRPMAVFHNWTGIVFFPFLLVTAITGAYLLFSRPVSRFLSRLDPGLAAPSVRIAPAASAQTSHFTLTDFSKVARDLFPGSTVTRIALPLKSGDPLVVRLRQPPESHPNGLTFLYFDPFSSAPVSVRNPLTGTLLSRLAGWQFPLHIGHYAGPLGRVIHILGGAALLVLTVSGLILFLRGFSRCRPGVRAGPTNGERVPVLESRSG